MRNGSRWWVSLAITGWLWAGSAGATNAVVTSCNDTGFSNALATVDGSGGGTITFNCGTATIVFANSKTIANAVTIDGGGTITLDGNTTLSMIQVFASANVVLKGLTLTHGGNSIGFTALENFGALSLDHMRLQSNTGSASTVKNHGTLTVRSSTFASNSATGSTTDGGAIYHDGIDLRVSASTFSANQAGRNGAAIYANSAPIVVTNTTFNGNAAGAAGGGGAIYQVGSGGTILYATIVGNSAPFGAGLYNDGSGNALTIGKSIVSANTTGNCDGVLASSGYNLSNGTGCGGVFTNTGDLVNQTLTMGALANNGGPTQTMVPAAGNPAINHVPLAQCAPNIDQRGYTRPSGAGCDSGAIEVGAPTLDTIFYDGFD